MKRCVLVLTAVLASTLGTTFAQEGALELTLEPATCSEGRPTQVRLTVKAASKEAQAVLFVAAQVGAEKSSQSWQRRKSGVKLAHLGAELVTLDLIASEDLSTSPVARAPMPDVRATLEGNPYVLCRYLPPGDSLTRTVTVVPLLPGPAAKLSWKAITLDPVKTKGTVYRRKQGQTWNPGADGQDLGGPPTLGAKTGLRVELTRWELWTGGKTGEVLIEGRAFKATTASTFEAGGALQVLPAEFGLVAAMTKAKLEGKTTAVRLKDERWILEQDGRWCIVGAEGDVKSGPGQLFPFALDLARSGRAGFMWHSYPDHPEVAEALQTAGFGDNRGKGMPIEVTEATLVPFLDLLAKHGVQLSESGIEKP